MGGDRLVNIRLAHLALLFLERLELGLAVADQLGWIATNHVDQALHLRLTGWQLEVFPDDGRDTLLVQKLERLARLAAARVVPDRDRHAPSMAALSHLVQ